MKKFTILETYIYSKWFEDLKDAKIKIAILRRLSRLEKGNFGDHKRLDNDLFELRFFIGAGYRVYYTIKGDEVILLISGGDKSTQNKDIQKAKEILEETNNE